MWPYVEEFNKVLILPEINLLVRTLRDYANLNKGIHLLYINLCDYAANEYFFKKRNNNKSIPISKLLPGYIRKYLTN